MIGDVITACFFGMSSVAAVQTADGYDLRIHNAQTNTVAPQSCTMDLGDVVVEVLWIAGPTSPEQPDGVYVTVSPGWQAYPNNVQVPENNHEHMHIFVTQELLG
jgi:hypothetical protein